jgi:hypothetical protein
MPRNPSPTCRSDTLIFSKISKVKQPNYIMSGDPLTMGYFDNLDNEPLNKYKKNLKNKKKFIDLFFYL